MKSKILSFSVISLLICMAGYAQDTKTITDKKKVFQIEIPANWVESSDANAFLNMTAIVNPDVPENRLTITVVKGVSNLKDSYKTNRDALKDFKDYTVMKEETGTLGEQECMWFTCTWTNDDGSKMMGKQYTIKASGKVFCIQYHVKEESFESTQESFDKVIQTIKINK
jgi:hypothetical protein